MDLFSISSPGGRSSRQGRKDRAVLLSLLARRQSKRISTLQRNRDPPYLGTPKRELKKRTEQSGSKSILKPVMACTKWSKYLSGFLGHMASDFWLQPWKPVIAEAGACSKSLDGSVWECLQRGGARNFFLFNWRNKVSGTPILRHSHIDSHSAW